MANGSRYYRVLESVSVASALSTTLRRRRQRTSPGEMSGVKSVAMGNLWEDVPVPQGTYQGGSRGYPELDWPASGQ